MRIQPLSMSGIVPHPQQHKFATTPRLGQILRCLARMVYGARPCTLWISRNQNISDACQNPPEALKDHLQNVVSGPNIEGITRTFDSTSIPGILTVEYNFEGPEQAIGSEIRLIEMNPNFSSECYI